MTQDEIKQVAAELAANSKRLQSVGMVDTLEGVTSLPVLVGEGESQRLARVAIDTLSAPVTAAAEQGIAAVKAAADAALGELGDLLDAINNEKLINMYDDAD